MERVEIPKGSVTFVLADKREVALNLLDTVDELNAVTDELEAEKKLRVDYLDRVSDVVARLCPEGPRLTRGEADDFDYVLRLELAKKKKRQNDSFVALRK